MMNWGDSIIMDIARRQCVLYLGSGVSHNSSNASGDHPMTWRAFLLTGAEKDELTTKQKLEIKKKVNNGDYLMACELLKRYLGDESFNDYLDTSFRTPRFTEAEIHKEIFKLDSRIVITPNFDNIYETYASNATHGAISSKNYYDNDIASSIRKRDPFILKLHGSISTPDQMIFTQVDYAKARNQYSSFYQLLNALLLTQTFLFMGAGLNDPDIKLLLENYAFQYKTSRKHYFLIPKNQLSPKEREIYEESLNIKFILYNPVDNHKELTDSLHELNTLVEAKRQVLAREQSW